MEQELPFTLLAPLSSLSSFCVVATPNLAPPPQLHTVQARRFAILEIMAFLTSISPILFVVCAYAGNLEFNIVTNQSLGCGSFLSS